MPKHTVREGDLILLPLSTGENAICRILYKSSYFRNVILLGIYGKHDPTKSLPADSKPLELIYCGSTSIKNGTWPCIGNMSLTESERNWPKRIVGGDVWLRDEYLGPVTLEMGKLPQMSVFGDKILIKAVERAISG